MGFVDAVKMGFNRYVDFQGRSRRSEFWWWYLFNFIVSLVLGWIPIVGLIVSLGLLLPNIAVSIRRLHDTDRTGWWILLPAAPYIVVILGIVMEAQILLILGGIAALGCIILLIVWYCTDGTKGPNRFGEDPKMRLDVEETFG